MSKNILLAVMLLLTCNSTQTLYIEDLGEASLNKNSVEGYNYMIRLTHNLNKRDVFGKDMFSQRTRLQPKEETIIILPNDGINNPYNTYPTNAVSRYNANKGTTVIIKNPDNNYDRAYGR